MFKPLRISLLALSCSLFLAGCANDTKNANSSPIEQTQWPVLNPPELYSPADYAFVTDLLKQMSIEQKVGQILQAEIQTISPEQAVEYHIGSILNGGGSVPERNPKASAADWASFADKYYQTVSKAGETTLTIPLIWGTDAVHGHGNLRGATLFPHNIGLGASHEPMLLKKIGEVTAKEVRASGIEWVFAPTVAVARNDLWGRTYESYSEDPQLVAKLAEQLIIGLQGEIGTSTYLDEQHVLATAKHFLADGGTIGGDDQGNAAISEADLINIHLPGYVAAINAGVGSIMASFSSWNGEKMHGNTYLLNQVLREKLHFEGLVVGDWNGHGQVPNCTNDSCPESFNAGVDLMMVPYDWKSMYQLTLNQVQQGLIPMARLDQAVSRILLAKKRLGLFNGKAPSERILDKQKEIVGSTEHRNVAREAVRKSLVLLKNNQQTLPINPKQHILVTGDGADNIAKQSGGWSVSWQGVGHTNTDFPGATSIYHGLHQAVTQQGGSIELSSDGSYQQKPDVAIVVFGEDPYAEGQGDLNTLDFLPRNRTLLDQMHTLKAQGIKVVSVFLSGRVMWTNPYINASDAFVAAWLPGSEGEGIADVLIADQLGEARFDFSGSLSFSWPKTPLQTTVNVGDKNYNPQFPVGYGLNYLSQDTLGLLPEIVEGVAQGESKQINLFQGRPMQPWQVSIKSHQHEQLLSGAFAQLIDGMATIKTIDKDVQEDALQLNFKDSWSSGIYFTNDKLDLSAYVEQGTLEFDLRIDAIEKGKVDLIVGCESDCKKVYRLREWAQQYQQKGWQHLSIALSCLLDSQSDLSQIRRPFTLSTGGEGQIALANVTFNAQGTANMPCPSQLDLATAADTLNEYWSVDWWMPRHEQKVEQANLGEAQLIMIGDSITHGWENDGKAVWEKYFADINTLNLGYGGDRTENVLWRLQHGELGATKPKLVVIMIGTNNTGHRMDSPKAIAAGVDAIVDEISAQVPEAKILLLAIFPREAKPDAVMRLNNGAATKLIADIAQRRNLLFANFNAGFLTTDGTLTTEMMPDLLHPKALGYEVWAKQLEPFVNQYIRSN
jgi:beta-glucosidase